ncbi:hypothetical protein [Pyrobaculum neutrophilum]|uniref:Uncharacterized protein n=1 Tax=Pyrobaculum neutrophilum (strain DSM 2338 / JCM 9278 / NBRC 100436 / V24Sta) TaxID=444157 RepID=B1Y983_PYRNV|nr:hypothetical protein [Pyrobaculum neutrophilum]ACB40312.1 conserved hypothetical protein [Pyrobaculum neutrophilum V24Sta]
MERLPEDVVAKLKKLSQELEGLGARSIVNYILYEFEVGGPSPEILDEAEQLVKLEMAELNEVLKVIEEVRKLVA